MFLVNLALQGSQIGPTLPTHIQNQVTEAISSSSALSPSGSSFQSNANSISSQQSHAASQLGPQFHFQQAQQPQQMQQFHQSQQPNLKPQIHQSPMNSPALSQASSFASPVLANSNASFTSSPSDLQNRSWVITPQEKQKYNQILKSVDIDNVGCIPGPAARSIFAKSGLHEAMLAHVWSLADMQNRGKLNTDEFAVAMYLIYRKLAGHDLPTVLPDNLVPPSQRDLSAMSNFAKLDAAQKPARRISPSVSLVGLSSVLPKNVNVPVSSRTIAETGAALSKAQEEREALLVLVNEKRKELAEIKASTESYAHQSAKIETQMELCKSQISDAKSKIVEITVNPPQRSLQSVDIGLLQTLESEISILLQSCKSTHKTKIELLKNIVVAPAIESVSSKAAMLLAARMAALGVSTTAAVKTAPEGTREEEEKGVRLNEIDGRFSVLIGRLRKGLRNGAIVPSPVVVAPIVVSPTAPAPVPQKASNPFVSIPPLVTNPFAAVAPGIPANPFAASIQATVTPVINIIQKLPQQVHMAPTQRVVVPKPSKSPVVDNPSLYTPPTITVLKSPSRAAFPVLTSPKSNAVCEAEADIAKSRAEKAAMMNDKAKNKSSTSLAMESDIAATKAKKALFLISIASGPKGKSSKSPTKQLSPVHSKIPKTESFVNNVPASVTSPSSVLFTSPTPPPPPPPPPGPFINREVFTEKAGVVKLPSLLNPIVAKPKPADVGAQGSNLFALLGPGEVQKKSQIGIIMPGFKQSRGNEILNIAGNAKKRNLPFLGEIKAKALPSIESQNRIENLKGGSDPFLSMSLDMLESAGSVEESWEIVHNSSPVTIELSKDVLTTPLFQTYQVVVEYDYQAAGENEISAFKGELLEVEQDDDEWLLCKPTIGESVWIPKSFVAHSSTTSPLDPVDMSCSNNVTCNSETFQIAEVLFDFEGRSDDEITLKAGQIVEVISKVDGDWWKVRFENRDGFAPTAFLKEYMPEDESWTHTLAMKRSSRCLSPNPFGSSAMIFTPSASEFPLLEDEFVADTADTSTREEFIRKEAVLEMIRTETSYLADLNTVKNQFLIPLSKTNIDTIKLFSNIMQIIEVNTLISRDFDNLGEQSIGSVFLKHLDALQSYKIYCENLADASAYLQKTRVADPTLHTFLKDQQKICKHLDLSSFLLIPMQRITRYSLLLRQILHYTARSHPEYDATLIALQMSDEFLELVNNTIKIKQNIMRVTAMVMLEIPTEDYKLDLSSPTRNMGDRALLHEGLILKNKSSRKLLVYLFTDYIILTHSRPGSKPYSLYRTPLMLDALSIREAAKIPNKDTGILDSTCFQIIVDEEVLTLRASSVADKLVWITKVTNAQNAVHQEGALNQKKPHTSVENIGTLNIQLLGVSGIESGQFRNIFALGRIKDQELKSRIVEASKPIFNQAMIFTLSSLDDCIKLSLYEYDKYSADSNHSTLTIVYIGEAEMQLDCLEYYAGKQTEEITLKLKDRNEKISLRMKFKAT